MNRLAGKTEQLLEEALAAWKQLSAQLEAQPELGCCPSYFTLLLSQESSYY